MAQYGFKIYLAKSKKKENEGPIELEDSTAIISYAKKLFEAADKLRKNIDAATEAIIDQASQLFA